MQHIKTIDAIQGQLGDSNSCLSLYLFGKYELIETYYTQLQLVIFDPILNTINEFKINTSGYDFYLLIGDFLGLNTNQLFIAGKEGGSLNYTYFNIYDYKNSELKLLFNNDSLLPYLQCKATYLNNYVVETTCSLNQTFYIDISNTFSGYLSMTYDSNGNIISTNQPIVGEFNTVYPIKYFSNYFCLQIQQQINGVSNGDVIGAIQSIIDLSNKEIKVLQQYLLIFNRT